MKMPKKGSKMDAPLVIQFTPERKDYVRASRALAMNSTGFIIIAAVIILAMIAAAVVLIFPSIGAAALNNAALIVLLVGAFYILYYLVFIPFQFTNMYKANEYLRKDRKLVFSESDVILQVGDKTSNLLWENFRSVIDGGGFYLLVYIDEKKVYPFIPKSAFTTDASEEEFLGLLKEKGIPIK